MSRTGERHDTGARADEPGVAGPWIKARAELQTGVDACINGDDVAMVAAWNLGTADLNAAVAAYKALGDCRPNGLGLDCG